VRGYRQTVGKQVIIARERQQLSESMRMLQESGKDNKDIEELIVTRE